MYITKDQGKGSRGQGCMEVIYTQGGILNPSLLQSNKDTRKHRMGMESGNHVTIFIPLILLTIYTGWNSQTIIVTEQQGHKKTQNGNGKWKSCHYFHTVNIIDHIHRVEFSNHHCYRATRTQENTEWEWKVEIMSLFSYR